ncbi:MAG: hypothetical protein CL566_00825 [Alphaproteobacteria bacterium]|nr:hypothetical protein [Alphaproteobacteria bacterium]
MKGAEKAVEEVAREAAGKALERVSTLAMSAGTLATGSRACSSGSPVGKLHTVPLNRKAASGPPFSPRPMLVRLVAHNRMEWRIEVGFEPRDA